MPLTFVFHNGRRSAAMKMKNNLATLDYKSTIVLPSRCCAKHSDVSGDLLLMTLSELYKKSVVYPGGILVVIASLYSTVAYWDYKDHQDGMSPKWEVIAMTIAFAIVYWLFICLLSRTIFLNRSEKVSSNRILSALSWFLLPFGFMLAVFGKAINEFVTVGSRWEVLYVMICNVPFIIGLIWGYKKFKKTDRR